MTNALQFNQVNGLQLIARGPRQLVNVGYKHHSKNQAWSQYGRRSITVTDVEI